MASEMSFTARHITTHDGLRLYLRDYGPDFADRTPLLCLAGLTRNSADFHVLAEALSRGPDARRVIALDARGRGRSSYDPQPTNYTPMVEAQDVLDCLTALGLQQVSVIGTSRGGILAMIIGALRPAALRAVILNDVGPVIETSGLLRIKAYLAAMPSFASWDMAISTLTTGLAKQFPALAPQQWTDFAHAIFREDGGRIIGDFDPRLAQGLKDISADTPDILLWPQFEGLANVPLMTIRGALSDILTPATLAAMLAVRPDLQVIEVPDQGHAPLLDDTTSITAIRRFLDSHC